MQKEVRIGASPKPELLFPAGEKLTKNPADDSTHLPTIDLLRERFKNSLYVLQLFICVYYIGIHDFIKILSFPTLHQAGPKLRC